MNRILTLDDLHRFYSSKGKQVHFNAKNDGDRIVVSVPGNLAFKKENKDIEGLLPVELQACHTLENINGSFISEKTMTAALPSFKNRPILGYIYKDDNGEYQFRDHTMHMEDDELVYDEKPVGIIPESCNVHLEYDKDKDKTYVNVNGYIFEEYSQAAEILNRESECSVSVELSIRELSYDTNNDRLNIEDFYFSGVTVLGRFEDGTEVRPGMQGSNIRIADFKQKNQTSFSQDEVIVMLSEINKKIDQLSINNSRKEESTMEFEENVEVTETLDETTVEETTEVMEETSEDAATTEEPTEEEIVTEAVSEDTEDVTPSEEFEENAEDTADDTDAETEEETEDEDVEAEETEKVEQNAKMSVAIGDKTFESFASLSDILNGLSTLVNDTYAEADGTFYMVDAYDDGTAKSRYVIMVDFWTGKAYKQSYQNKDGVLSLKGDRVPVYSEWVTEDERAELENMRSNYSALMSELAQYKAEPEKLEILESDRYDLIREQEDFVALSQRESYFELSVEEVKAKADSILLEYAATGLKDYSAKDSSEDKKHVSRKAFSIIPKKKNYGSLLDV